MNIFIFLHLRKTIFGICEKPISQYLTLNTKTCVFKISGNLFHLKSLILSHKASILVENGSKSETYKPWNRFSYYAGSVVRHINRCCSLQRFQVFEKFFITRVLFIFLVRQFSLKFVSVSRKTWPDSVFSRGHSNCSYYRSIRYNLFVPFVLN